MKERSLLSGPDLPKTLVRLDFTVRRVYCYQSWDARKYYSTFV
jgi:hypothetical protein